VLLGRDRECAAIDRLLDDARESRSGALVLLGEPGIGKSALVAYALERADGMRVLSGAAVEAERHFEAAVEQLAAARPLDRARVHLHFGEHLRRERRRIDARTHLRAALEGFERLGAVPWSERWDRLAVRADPARPGLRSGAG
jgi:hypothetical protein